MGYAVNLVLTLATAALAFSVTLVKDDKLRCHEWGRLLLAFAGLLLILSGGLGLWCVLNRLRNFRETSRIAREREKMESEKLGKEWIDKQLREKRRKTRNIGNRTWTLLRWQLMTFAGGVLLLVAAFLAVYHANLL